MYSYLVDEDFVDKKGKGTKKHVIKQEIKFQDCKECLKNDKTILNSPQRSGRRLYPLKRSTRCKIALIANDGWIHLIFICCTSWNSVQSRIDKKTENKKLNIMINFDEAVGENTQECNLADHIFMTIYTEY